MTRQEIFDKVARHLLTQNEKSIADVLVGEGGCAYRGANGLKCAIGCLIPDKYSLWEYEGSSVAALLLSGDFSEYLGGMENEDFLDRLQFMHDTYAVEEWRWALENFAKDFNLSVEILNEIK